MNSKLQNEQPSQGKSPIEYAYLGTFATNLLIQGCTVLQGVLLARMLGPAGRGELATVILWPNIFAGIGILGVDMAIARLAGQGHDADTLVRTAIRAALMTGILTAIICGLLLAVLLPPAKHTLLSAAYFFTLFIPLNHLALNLQGIDHGLGNFYWLNTTRALLYPIFFTGLAICWWFAIDKVFWVAAALLAANGSVVCLRLVARRKNHWFSGQAVESATLLNESRPFVAASIVSIMYMQMDKALIVWLLSPEEIGWYVAAFAAAGSVNILNSALGIVQFSAAAQAQSGYGFPALAAVLRRGSLLSLGGGVILAALLPWLLPLVYGDDFRPAVAIAFLLLPGLVVAGLGDIVNQALRGQGRPVAGVISKVFGLVVMGVTGAIFAENWGGGGIACGYLAGELVAVGGLLLVAGRFYRDVDWSALRPTMEDVGFLWSRVFAHKNVAEL